MHYLKVFAIATTFSACSNAANSFLDGSFSGLFPGFSDLTGGNGGNNGDGGRAGGGTAGGRPPSTNAIDNAQQSWQRDTGIVSQFLSTATSLPRNQLQAAASKALSAENDELTHKAVLDRMFLNGPRQNRLASIRQANNALETQGNFQLVVDGLDLLASRGARMSPQQVERKITSITTGRCQNVLPAIDDYFAAAGNLIQSTGTNLKAIRPNNC
ncbi:hypothetical protein LMH87_000115 [Akanthomyces muscarius]|uniref:Uncharacterized protein n=1 Tax=Akanthomyces muscarius TaxID=2231603 RepID=A0A9W8QEE7_AKAMU|nr:hypothetical protein LMH87_000115 [Akanthomyces muscarius]KAJ4154840.1 hypothetical protein LMH87_000115 [Akanthomyces muscarius]